MADTGDCIVSILVRTMSGTTVFDISLSRKATYAAIALLGLAGVAVIYIFDPRIQGIYPVCPFFGLTGYHCAGCGTLRALHSLLHADLIGALGYNLFAVAALPFITYSYLSGAARAFTARSMPRVFVPQRWIWTLLAAIISFWIIRNLPVQPPRSLSRALRKNFRPAPR